MNIIICGAGRVGFTIAKQLSEQGHSITVIDQSSEDIQKIDDSLDVKAIVGKATYPSILEKANASEADMIIAVTRNDEINMVICQIAFSIFNIPKKIARIRSQDYLNPKFTRVYNKENLPIDVIISPEIEIAKSIQRKLEAPGALDSVPFAENKIRLLEIQINDNCNLINIKLKDLTNKHPNLDANIIGIIRGDKFLIPKKNDDIKKNDKIYVLINSSQMAETLDAFGHNEKITKKILIVGGGNIGFNLAKNLEETLDYILNNNVSKNDAFSFLDLMHLSSISKTIASHDSNQWAMKIAQVIEKHNFHTGQLLLQREKRYKDKIAIHTIDGDKRQDITYSKLWNDVLKTSIAIKKASNNQKTTIGMLSHNQYKSAVVDLACLSSGIRIIPIPLNATREHLIFIIKEYYL